MTELLAKGQQDLLASNLAGRRLGRYEVLARLAVGGMASVYVARALGVAGFERLFAVKVLHAHLAHAEEFIAMFLDEARLAARIRHPNVVPTIDISDSPDAGYYLVMDYIEGDHLGMLMKQAANRGVSLPYGVSLRMIVDALSGLAAAHELTDEAGQPLNLVHRDVSPQNIMVGLDGISRLTDFGVAKAEARLSNTGEGQFKGKVAYMAPEHASAGAADQRSDLFAMGTILWECLAGRRLFRAENHAATLNKVCLEPIPLPSSVDPALEPFDPVLAKALARDPDERFGTALEFAEAIEKQSPALGGVDAQRGVGNLVKEYAADKLAQERQLVREAIAAIDSEAEPPSNWASLSIPPASRAHAPAAPVEVAAPAEPAPTPAAATEADAQVYSPVPPTATQATNPISWVVAGVAVAMAAGVGIAFALTGAREPEAITTSPLADSTEAPAAPAAPPTPAEPKPEPAQPTESTSSDQPTTAKTPVKPATPPQPQEVAPTTGPQRGTPGARPQPAFKAGAGRTVRRPAGRTAGRRRPRAPSQPRGSKQKTVSPPSPSPRRDNLRPDILRNPYR